jgi:PAS domain S-box-containing protein
MAQGKMKLKQWHGRDVHQKSWWSSQLVQAGFVGLCIIVTFLAFGAMNTHVRTMAQKEYERVTQEVVESTAFELSELEQSVSALADTLTMYEHIQRPDLVETVRQSFYDIERFDQLTWLYQSSPGKWQVANIYTKDKSDSVAKRYSVKMDKELLSYITTHKIFTVDDVKIHTDLEFISHENKSATTPDMQSAPFALIKTVKAGDLSAGLIIAVAVLDEALMDKQKQTYARVNIREVNTGYDLYQGAQLAEAGSSDSVLSPAYEFMFAGSTFEIRTQFVAGEHVRFLRFVPFLVAIFGVMIMAFGTLYIRSNSSKAIQVSKMYKELEQKNVELESEVQKRAGLNNALTQAERENRAIIDAVSDIIFEVDTDGKILFLSAAWHKVTGFEPERSMSLELFKMLHSHDQEQQQKDFQLMVRGQKQAYRAFARLRTSDGTFRAVEIAFSMVRQDENKNLRIVGTITDVEERRRAERALSEAEKKYRAIVENAAGGIYQLTPEGVYLSANPAMARILGYDSPEDLLREIKNANDSVYVDPRERQGFLRELDKRDVINSYEIEVMRKDGSRIWVNENVRVVRDESNNILYYEGSLEEITGRKKSEMAMREAKVHSDLANRAKSEFLANMSHELRTPLNAIIGFSEMIKNEVFGPIEQKSYWEYAKDIHESGNNLLRIINEILDISKIEAGERQLNEGLVDLNSVVESCLDLMSNKVESNKMTISNNLQNVPQIVGEELAIKQILMNLLSNAIKFTPSNGRITISAETDANNQLRLAITDTGIGLDKMEIEKALSPFGQLDNELSRSSGGTGLGLTLVDALIKLHGGQFELFSQKGIGTTATVIFPADRVTVKKSISQSSGETSGEKEEA